MTIRIAQILPALNRGGMERFSIALAHSLQTTFATQLFCTSEAGPLSGVAESLGLRVRVARSPILANFWPQELLSELRSFSPTVIHSHSGSWLKAAVAGKTLGVSRVIHTIHGFHEGRLWLHEPIERLAVRKTDAIVAVSEEQAQYAIERLHAPSARVHIIRNGIDTSRYRAIADARRTRFSSTDKPLVVGFIGRLIDVKDPLLLLEGFQRAAEQLAGNADISLEYVGDGPLRSTLSEAIARSRHKQSISLHGAVDDVSTYLERFDLLVLSSRSEGTSLAALEAMAAGCPVVAFDVGGNGDLLNGECGVLIKERSTEALASAIVNIALSRSMLERISANAFKKVNREYSLEAAVNKYLELYFA